MMHRHVVGSKVRGQLLVEAMRFNDRDGIDDVWMEVERPVNRALSFVRQWTFACARNGLWWAMKASKANK